MNVGDTVTVYLGLNRESEGEVIDIKGDIVSVAGFEEIHRAASQGRRPIGLTFRREKVKEKREKISLETP